MLVVASRAVMGRVDMAHLTYEDAVAIHRAHQQGGDDAALAEVRRRWLGLADHVYQGLLDRVLRLKIDLPKPPVNERAPPSPGAPESERKAFQALERKRVRAKEQRDRERRERIRAD